MASNWFGERQPLSRSYFNNDGAGPARGIYGDQSVHYNENGRLVYPGQPSDRDRPTNMLFWRRGGGGGGAVGPPQSTDIVTAAPVPSNFRYRPWARTVMTPSTVDQASAPIITRRVDRFGFGNPGYLYQRDELPYATGRATAVGLPPMASTATKTTTRTTMTPETIVVEEMRVYDQKPCCWWLYLIVGLLMFGDGIASAVLCWEFHSYCCFWTGIFVVIFAIVCAIHRGDYYEKKWKSWLLILVGFVTTVLIMASTFLLLKTFCHQILEIAQFLPDQYIVTEKYRYNYFNMTPLVTLKNDYTYNIWSCLGIDAFEILLLMASMGVLTTTVYVLDTFYNSHYVITRKVDPFCAPWLFNPWGQCSLGQAMIVVGCAVGSSEHGTRDVYVSWFESYAPVWAGILPVFAGIGAALALKNCDKAKRKLPWIGAILELLSLIASVVALVLVTNFLAKNVTTLLDGDVMIVTTTGKNIIVASVLLEGFSDVVCIVNIFYSLSLMFRIFACLCTNWYAVEDTEDKRYVLDDGSGIDNAAVTTTEEKTVVSPRATAMTTQTTSEVPRFDPYRPMGTRSFYMR